MSLCLQYCSPSSWGFMLWNYNMYTIFCFYTLFIHLTSFLPRAPSSHTIPESPVRHCPSSVAQYQSEHGRTNAGEAPCGRQRRVRFRGGGGRSPVLPWPPQGLLRRAGRAAIWHFEDTQATQRLGEKRQGHPEDEGRPGAGGGPHFPRPAPHFRFDREPFPLGQWSLTHDGQLRAYSWWQTGLGTREWCDSLNVWDVMSPVLIPTVSSLK